MAYAMQSTNKPTVSAILATNAIKNLGQNLELTQAQLARAKSSALTLSSDPKLAKCDPYSLVKYCFETARYNFTRDDCVYPVPYGDKVQAQVGYKGYRELAMRSNKYNDINCSEVKECDRVFRDKETGKIRVEFNEDYKQALTAKTVGFYAFAVNKEGQLTNSLFWSIEDVEKHGKHYSKTYSSIWGDKEFGFVKMAKKTVIKQLCNELDQTPELKEALKLDQIVYGKENELDEYLDNPNNTTSKVIDFSEPKQVENVVETAPVDEVKEETKNVEESKDGSLPWEE